MIEKFKNNVLEKAKLILKPSTVNIMYYSNNYNVLKGILYLVNFLMIIIFLNKPFYLSFKLIIIILMDFIYYDCIKAYKNSTDKSLIKEKLNMAKYTVIFSFSFLLISYILFFFENPILIIYKIENWCTGDILHRLKIIIISCFFLLLSFLFSIILSNNFYSYCIEYDFSINNIIANKNYFRLKVWNYIMYKDLNGESSNEEINNGNNIILVRKIIDSNRILIDNEEHEKFKNKLKSMKKECLEKILFYDQLPIFKKNDSFNFIDELTKAEGISHYVLALFTILLPILLENSFSSIVSWFNSLSKPILLLVICIIFILTLCAWNLYKIFKFVDKRKQIDSFFFNDVKEAL